MTQNKLTLSIKLIAFVLILLIPSINYVFTDNFVNTSQKNIKSSVIKTLNKDSTINNKTKIKNSITYSTDKKNINVINNNAKMNTNSLSHLQTITSFINYSTQITVTSNSTFITNGFVSKNGSLIGAGTKSNPWILANYNFTPLSSPAITISNTNAFFEIINNTSSIGPNTVSTLISLNNVQNGFIVNNTFSNFNYPIYITGSSSKYISIINNTLIGSINHGFDGIAVSGAFGNIITINNTIKNFISGIGMTSTGGNNVIMNNTIENNSQNGIYISATTNNTISNNYMINNYLYIATSGLGITKNNLNQFAVTNNFVNGRPIDYIQSTDSPIFSANPAEIIVINSTNVKIQNLPELSGPIIVSYCSNPQINNMIIKNSTYNGLELYYDTNISINNNTISTYDSHGIIGSIINSNMSIINNIITHNDSYPCSVSYCDGIHFSISGENSSILNNSINGFQYGLYLYGYLNDTIQGNTISNTSDYAIILSGTGPLKTLKDNRFYNNSIRLIGLKTLEFTNNTFNDKPIIILSNLSIQIISPGGSIPSVYGQLFIENSSFLEISNLTFLFDLSLLNCFNVSINNITIKVNGLDLEFTNVITVKNSNISNTNPNTNSVDAEYTANGINIVSNYTYSNSIIIADNVLTGSKTQIIYQKGINAGATNNIQIINNIIKDFSIGIFLNQTTYSNVNNNTIKYIDSTKGLYGVQIYNIQSLENKILNSNINNFYDGIFIASGMLTNAENNKITNNTNGILIDSSSFNTASFNIISSNGYGINLLNTQNNDFNDNVFSYNGNDNLKLTTSSLNNFLNNVFTNTSYNNIELLTSSLNNTFSGNRFSNNNYYMFLDTTSGNNIIEDNIFLDTLYVALLINSANNLITNNDFIGNNWTNTNFPPGRQIKVLNANNIVVGNYYSDHSNLDFNWDVIADSPYTNFGTTSLIDPYPKVRPIFLPDVIAPLIFVTPANNTVFNMSGFILSYNISERSVTQIYINGTTNSTLLPSGSNMSYLGDGIYNITIVATDLAGNIGITQISVDIDTMPPQITFINPINSSYDNLKLNVSYFVIERSNYSMIIYINGIQNNTVFNNTFWTFKEGENNITIYSIDQVGNSATILLYFTIDVSPPIIRVNNPSNETYHQAEVYFNYSITDLSAYTTSIFINGTANVTNIPSNSYVKFTNGYYNITFYAIDTFNHNTTISIFITLDIYPTVAIYTLANTSYNTHDLLINYTSSYTVRIKFYVDNVAMNITNDTLIHFTKDGYHNITIVGFDALNRTNTKIYIFLLDTVAPIITITSPLSTTSTTGTIAISYQILESNAYKTIILIDGKANITNIASGTILQFIDGTHNITIYVIDNAGNSDLKTVLFTVSTSNTSGTTGISSTNPYSITENSQSNASTTENKTHNTPISFMAVLIGLLILTLTRLIYLRKRKEN